MDLRKRGARPDSREKRTVMPTPRDPSIKVRFRTSLHNTVCDVMASLPGWEETETDGDWDLHWADVGWVRENFDLMEPRWRDHQRISHFKNHYELTRKDLLVKNLKRMKRQQSKSSDLSTEEMALPDFWSLTFVLPMEYGMFLEDFKRCPGALWIMKPIGKAQGRGIFLFDKLSQISDWKKDHTWKTDQTKTSDTYIVQKYIENPYTIGGKKFDLRLYVLVTSFSPLVFWIYRADMHLTNASVQKTANDYDKTMGCKWPLAQIKQFMASKHGVRAVDTLFFDIQMVITRSLQAVQPILIQNKHCFELYGYDVLIDSQLKPWLLEVNASPSLTGDTEQDYNLKWNLIKHTMEVIDMEKRRSGTELHVGGFDLIWDNGPVKNAHPDGYLSYLGCVFPMEDHPPRSKSQPLSA
ncbi:tubulin-tyrosine ligase family [Achlya hypogyna]|uniref:Tubulin--tyrosine ligase-like protein 9 n=1 Tax=Achlya hypogyna TaxID=1202772 RepID=A0A1V9YXX6_ACHHY|nr:tubulin-tyrosine ligase family [Achlya hypogyna]